MISLVTRVFLVTGVTGSSFSFRDIVNGFKNAHSSSSMFADFWLWAALRSKSCQPKCSVNFFGRPRLSLTVSYAHEFPYCHVHSSFTAFAVYGWLGGKVRSPTAVFGTFGQCSEAERYWGNAAFFQRGATQGHLPADLIALHCSTINSGLGCIDKQNAFLTHVQNGARFRIANEIHQLLISWDSNLEITCSHIQTSLINGVKKTYPNSKIDIGAWPFLWYYVVLHLLFSWNHNFL